MDSKAGYFGAGFSVNPDMSVIWDVCYKMCFHVMQQNGVGGKHQAKLNHFFQLTTDRQLDEQKSSKHQQLRGRRRRGRPPGSKNNKPLRSHKQHQHKSATTKTMIKHEQQRDMFQVEVKKGDGSSNGGSECCLVQSDPDDDDMSCPVVGVDDIGRMVKSWIEHFSHHYPCDDVTHEIQL